MVKEALQSAIKLAQDNSHQAVVPACFFEPAGAGGQPGFGHPEKTGSKYRSTQGRAVIGVRTSVEDTLGDLESWWISDDTDESDEGIPLALIELSAAIISRILSFRNSINITCRYD